MGVEEVADELYGLAPGAFIAARTVREREARSAGERDLAGNIRKLGKPSTAAWLVNQLVREHPGAVLPLLDLGAGLQVAAAALDGPQLRELDRQQYQLLDALVGVARTIAAAAGQPVSPDTARAVEDTLRAALADDGVADLLRAGRLTEARHPGASSFPVAAPVPAAPSRAGAVEAPVSLEAHREARHRAAAADRAAKADEERAARQRAAEQDEDRERRAVDAAEQELARGRSEADRAEQQGLEATATIDRLRADLAAALTVQATVQVGLTAARTVVEVAERAAGAAHRRLIDAGARRELLQRPPTDV